MRIGEVAAGAGVNVQTLRYYERRGRLPEPGRRGAGYRAYDPAELIELRRTTSRGAEVRALAAAKVEDIERRMGHLRAMRDALGGLVDACECEDTSPACPIIEALDEPVGSFVASVARREG
jgi:MerR family mercuric resistance operon transcriptional regulator